jgi:hypothetical protein
MTAPPSENPPHEPQLTREPDPSGQPTRERAYLTDAAGQRWRVYDAAYGPPHAEPYKRRRTRPGDPRATYRYFVPAEGWTRLYRFGAQNSRELTLELALRQLLASEYAGSAGLEAERDRAEGGQR